MYCIALPSTVDWINVISILFRFQFLEEGRLPLKYHCQLYSYQKTFIKMANNDKRCLSNNGRISCRKHCKKTYFCANNFFM